VIIYLHLQHATTRNFGLDVTTPNSTGPIKCVITIITEIETLTTGGGRVLCTGIRYPIPDTRYSIPGTVLIRTIFSIDFQYAHFKILYLMIETSYRLFDTFLTKTTDKSSL